MKTSARLEMVRDIEPGKVQLRHACGDSALRYYLYVPRRIRLPASQYFSIHGISRNAGEHARLFAPLAEQYGVVLVAPCFTRRHFGDYQRLGRAGSGRRADRVIRIISREVESLTGAGSGKISLFGFSGGGQFAHRYAMACPVHVERVVIGAAGWYTYPDETCRYPYGTAPTSRLADIRFDMKRFLQVPACVLVGQWDITHDAGLNNTARIQRQQGTTRLERGRRWVDAMNRAAIAHGMGASFEFSILSGVGHDFTRAMNGCRMGERVFSYLFGAAPSAQDITEPSSPPAGTPLSQTLLIHRMAGGGGR